MTERGIAIAHAIVGLANVALVVVCTVYAVMAVRSGMISLYFFDCALFVANAYMAYYNFGEAKRLL